MGQAAGRPSGSQTGTRFSLVVREVRVEAEAVVSLRLGDPSGALLPSWTPGAHLDLVLPSGRVRQYSLCGRPADRSVYEVAVLRQDDGRGGSVEVHRDVREGTAIDVLGPRNRFELTDADGYLFLAGGIGVTPLVPMAREVSGTGKPWRMVYGGRSLSSMAFAGQLRDLDADSVELVPQDECGLPDLDALLRDVPAGHEVFCCGPAPMIDAVRSVCAGLGIDDVLHVERFASEERPTPPGEADSAIEVRLALTGEVLLVPPDRSVLDVVRERVPDVLFSCGEGDCGTCETRVLEGVPDHRDWVLTEDEREAGDTMMICVSRAKTTHLTLEL